MFHNETKCVLEFPPAVAGGIRPIFMGGNRGRGRFQFFQPRHWRCLCMVLTLVLHRQLTSLAETFDGLSQGLHKILRANSDRTLDNLHFSGNKSLHEENDLRKTPSLTPLPANFMLGEIPLCRQPAAGHVLTYVFHRQLESLAENSDRFA